MRALFVNQYFPPDVSATAYLLGELAEDLATEHDVWVVAGRPSYNADTGTYRPQGVRVRRAWSTTFPRSRMPARLANYATFTAASVVEAMSVPRPDVVVGLTDPPVIGLVAMLAARRYRAPFVYVCQDVFPDVSVALGRADNPAFVRLWHGLNRLLRGGADRVVAVGRDMQQKLAGEGVPPERIAYIPNWAGDPAVDPSAAAVARRSLGWEGRHVVMHGGNVGLAQRLETLIEAAGLLRDRPEVVIAIVGDGAAREGLEREVARRRLPNVQFLPYRPKDEAQAILAAADVHVISLAPGLAGSVVPSKLYGILSLGRPFVAAVERDSEIDLVIRETESGVRVDPGDARALAGAIRELVDGTRDGAAMGAAGRRAFERTYTRDLGTARYRRLLEEVAGATRETASTGSALPREPLVSSATGFTLDEKEPKSGAS